MKSLDLFFHPVTNAQMKGPQYSSSGLAPRTTQGERSFAVEDLDDSKAIDPQGGLARLLGDRRLTRSTRRALLAAVQANNPKRRAQLEQKAMAGLAAAGIIRRVIA